MDDYMLQVQDEIRRWEARGPSTLSKASATLLAPAQKAAEAMVPRWLQEEATETLELAMRRLQAVSYHLIDVEGLRREMFAQVATEHSILKASDTLARRCWAWNLVYAGAEGALTGSAGWAGFLLDVPALYTLSLRTIQEIAVCYGFDVTLIEEQDYIHQLLKLGASGTFETKFALLVEVKKVELALLQDAVRMAGGMAQGHVLRVAMKEVAQSVGTSLIKRKSLQLIPVVGAIFGATANTYFLHDLAETAFMCYRRRRLSDMLAADLPH